MRRWRRLIVITLAAMALLPVAGRAQGMTRERIRRSMEETDRRIESAEPVVLASGDAQARDEFAVAVDLQGRARRADRAGRALGALQLTRGARERCTRALRLCRVEDGGQQVAERAVRRTDEVLAGAREQLRPEARGGEPSARLADDLARAAALQDDATRHLRDGHWEPCLRLTLEARRLAHRAVGRGPRGRPVPR